MSLVYVYPGRFSPPTYGHYSMIKKAAKILPNVTVICSTNPKKEDIYSTEESKLLLHSYNLPKNVTVVTFDEFTSSSFNPKNIVIIRGLRSFDDLVDEKIVMELNRKKHKIDKYFYMLSECGFEGISASKVRKMAANIDVEHLNDYVSPLVTTSLLEKYLNQKNIFMVVGKPGSGKSTFLEILDQMDNNNIHVNTDMLNKEFKEFLKEHFGEEDMAKVALDEPERFTRIIKTPWMNLLSKTLKDLPQNKNVFLEIPYGLMAGKEMYKYVGGNVIYFGCEQEDTNVERVVKRGTSHMLPFVEAIPDLHESKKISNDKKLNLISLNTDFHLKQINKQVFMFNKMIKNKGRSTWKTYLQKLS